MNVTIKDPSTAAYCYTYAFAQDDKRYYPPQPYYLHPTHMKPSILPKAAQDIIAHYQALKFGKHAVVCPYYNNKRTQVRAALRVLVGKGTPTDIEEEATLIALREKIDISTLTNEELTAFLVDHHLGADCSGFAFHVLNAATHGKLKKTITPFTKNPLRKLLAKLRTVENVNVKVLADDRNSKAIDLADVQAGDIISMIGTGKNNDLDHVLVIAEVSNNILHYVHSLQWKADGKYNHGIKTGSITIKDETKDLLKQTWEEAGETTKTKNETLWRASTAKRLELRRIHIL